MNALYILAIFVTLGICYLYYKRDEDRAEKRYKQGFTLWRLTFVPIYIIIALSLMYKGGLIALTALVIITFLFGLYILVFEPHKKVNQVRQKA